MNAPAPINALHDNTSHLGRYATRRGPDASARVSSACLFVYLCLVLLTRSIAILTLKIDETLVLSGGGDVISSPEILG